MSSTVPFSLLQSADLIVDRMYQSGSLGHAGDDPLAALLPVGNQGGFRYSGSPKRNDVRMVVLYSSRVNPDWPDSLDVATGIFTYYGDNREPGSDLHDTPRKGNAILRSAFAAAQAGPRGRAQVPPFLLFERAGTGRSVRFRGLLVPGSAAVPPDQHLVAVWRSRNGSRFQNYRAVFTVLDAPTITRRWINELLAPGEFWTTSEEAPAAWRDWALADAYQPLLAPSTMTHRGRAAQEPGDPVGQQMLEFLWQFFSPRPIDFEACAVELFRIQAPAVESVELTRASRDGGRDAVGLYGIGPADDRVRLEFALEAKCYRPGSAVGVAEVARLVSRLKHRQFGVLVTTSYVHEQAYKEIRQDQHPVVILSGRDIVGVLRGAGIGTVAELQVWLTRKYPTTA